VEEDGEFEVIAISKAAGHFLDRLHRRIHPLANGICCPMLHKSQDVAQIFSEHSGNLLDRLQPRADRPAIPVRITHEKPGRANLIKRQLYVIVSNYFE